MTPEEQATPPSWTFTGTLCSICSGRQFSSSSGITCPAGHGGAPAAADALEAAEENRRQDTTKIIELAKHIGKQEDALDAQATEIAGLRLAIIAGPHGMGCQSLQFPQADSNWGHLDHCDCWKIKALAKGDHD